VNLALDEMKADGTLDDIEQQWLADKTNAPVLDLAIRVAAGVAGEVPEPAGRSYTPRPETAVRGSSPR
jgi:hypothetical protein